MATVLFFGKLKDELRLDQLEVSVADGDDVASVRCDLVEQHPYWQDILFGQPLMIAVDQKMGTLSSKVNENSEIAFFPPVTGG